MVVEVQIWLVVQDIFNVVVVEGVMVEGCKSQVFYDVMLIEGVIEVMFDVLVDQLCDGGCVIVIFCEGNFGIVKIGCKVDGCINWCFVFNVNVLVLLGFIKVCGFVL